MDMGQPHRQSVPPPPPLPPPPFCPLFFVFAPRVYLCSEFYMNCAPVVVVGTAGSSFTGPRIFEANIFGQGTCNTVEGVDVVYPNPGKSVHFGGAFVGGNTGPATTLANCPFDQNVDLTTTGSGASASAGNGASNGILPSTTFSDIRFLWFFSFICRCCSHCWCRRRTDSRPTS